MPGVTHNGQCFRIDGHRVWIVGASMSYARVPHDLWPDRLAAIRQAGFNTVESACPWFLHEPRKGRFGFADDLDVGAFLDACSDAGLRAILRIGPYVGDGFDGGGIPAWLADEPGIRPREAHPYFLDRTGRFLRKLLAEVTPRQVTNDGPLLAVQIEHAWDCGNDAEAARYLGEIARITRENGVNVPIVNANNLWVDAHGTIDAWRGDADLLTNLRQLRTLQPDTPRLATAFGTDARIPWGSSIPERTSAAGMMKGMAEILAAGAQPIVSPFHGGTNFGFTAGRSTGPDGGTLLTSAAVLAPLGEAGARGERYQRIRRIATFASHFGHVFSDLDPEYHPAVLDPGTLGAAPTKRAKRETSPLSIVPLRGGGGRVVFVFGDGGVTKSALLLDSGIRLPIDLGDQPVAWYAFDIDLHGRGKLDYCNLCPIALVDRSVLVVTGPDRAQVLFSINGTPQESTVPTGSKPRLLEHKGLTIVICNSAQMDAMYVDDEAVYIGIDGFDRDGRPIPLAGWSKACRIDASGEPAPIEFEAVATTSRGSSKAVAGWKAAPATAYVDGTSPRFASLAGPQSLSACGTLEGYGWYRLRLDTKSARKRHVHLPEGGDRLHFYLREHAVGAIGHGPGFHEAPFDLTLEKGANTLTILAENAGRLTGGHELLGDTGVFGHLYEVKRLGSVRPKHGKGAPLDPFALRTFIDGLAPGQIGEEAQITWSFSHAKKLPILVAIEPCDVRGTLALNDHPIAYLAGDAGPSGQSIMLKPGATEAMKRGKNVLRFGPDPGHASPQSVMATAVTLYECVESLTAKADWAFAKWEPPATAAFKPPTKGLKGRPCWWRTTFATSSSALPSWLAAIGLSKGHVFLNGRSLGRFFTATATGKAVGPQRHLYLPAAWLKASGPNELIIFDENGFSPDQVRIVQKLQGDLDG